VQVAGIVGALALGYAASWAFTPDPMTGPVDSFPSTFGQSLPPVVVAPAQTGPSPSRAPQKLDQIQSRPLQKSAAEPI
jgi:hypothetical protein